MGLETGTYISALNASNPVTGDPKTQGDDHLRLIKSTLLSTFPNITGAVTSSHTELNLLDGSGSASWTPGISFGGGTTGLTYSLQVGRYARFGSMIWVAGRITMSAKGSSTGNALITGLPATTYTDAGRGAGIVGFYANMASVTGGIILHGSTSSTTILMHTPGATQSSSLTDANFNNTSDMIFSMIFEAA